MLTLSSCCSGKLIRAFLYQTCHLILSHFLLQFLFTGLHGGKSALPGREASTLEHGQLLITDVIDITQDVSKVVLVVLD